MSKITFPEVWDKIVSNEGNIFHTKKGIEFKYTIKNNTFNPSRTEWNISKTDFEKAFNRLPLNGPGDINKLVQGPAYIWAVLNDNRIITQGIET